MPDAIVPFAGSCHLLLPFDAVTLLVPLSVLGWREGVFWADMEITNFEVDSQFNEIRDFLLEVKSGYLRLECDATGYYSCVLAPIAHHDSAMGRLRLGFEHDGQDYTPEEVLD